MDHSALLVLTSNTAGVELKSTHSASRPMESNKKEKVSFDSALNKATNLDNKNKTQSVVNDKIKAVNKKNSLETKTTKEEEIQPDEAILSLMSTALQVPVEKLIETLQTLELEPIDLLQLDHFKNFIGAIYQETNEGELLLANVNLKNISKLFEELQDLGENFENNILQSKVIETEEGSFLVEEKIITDKVVDTQVTALDKGEEDSLVQQVVDVIEGNEQAVNEKGLMLQETIANLEVAAQGGEKDNEQVAANHTDGNLEETFLNLKEFGLGLSVPIQGFTHSFQIKNGEGQLATNYLNEAMREAPLTNQIIDRIEMKTFLNTQEVNMQLSPKELGNLSIKLTETNGILVADIKVDNDRTKELILSEVGRLKETLQEQGLQVGEVKVDVRQNSHHSHMEKQKQKSTRRIQELIQKHLYSEEISQEKEQIRENISQNQVDYMV
ncbi:hypothetical protein CS063_04085 [Sporanaerobium hydrogeniformans]|uniref:Uncharacterized protein n=1 Tax=Sporanaerobium hydrogeniformans TaxID=3072179 RepID=A0AC61DEK0_9FIRM|nr:flagellar hook-length control protein FliK [Sporanaerobium hydrogeniformans]PHV71744.1 hypothetical protein CS063_04085 [Sporanaerobium hydrogeniformans]